MEQNKKTEEKQITNPSLSAALYSPTVPVLTILTVFRVLLDLRVHSPVCRLL